jgi:hypothetical protein
MPPLKLARHEKPQNPCHEKPQNPRQENPQNPQNPRDEEKRQELPISVQVATEMSETAAHKTTTTVIFRPSV